MVLVKIAPGAPDQAGARRPAPALEHPLLAEVRLGILLVGIADVPGIRLEGVRHPLPRVAEHLSAADRAVASRQRADVDASPRPVVEIGPLGPGRLVAPREAALAARCGVERGRPLPLR